jgi:small GTP-binding protein
MRKKKICMLGAFAVGKTSLVQQLITSKFSAKYHATIGVEVGKKEMSVEGQDIDLLIWDIQGEDASQEISSGYLRGSAGIIFVADGTRKETLDTVTTISQRVKESIGPIPSVLLINKYDKSEDWEVDDAAINRLNAQGWSTQKTSAKTGMGVEAAFEVLARDIFEK